MKYIVSLLLVFLTNWILAQLSVSAGGSMLKGFGPNKPWGGFHLGLEIPRDDAVSFYLRFTHHFKQYDVDSISVYLEPKDITTFPTDMPYYPTLNGRPSMNYNILEGGTRYYLGNGFDYGWAAYGGTHFMAVFNTVKSNYDSYDETIYKMDESFRLDGTIFSLGAGLQGGVKYSAVPYGTFYLDAGLAYMLFAQGSTNFVYPNMFNQLIFSFNIGYRRDILW